MDAVWWTHWTHYNGEMHGYFQGAIVDRIIYNNVAFIVDTL